MTTNLVSITVITVKRYNFIGQINIFKIRCWVRVLVESKQSLKSKLSGLLYDFGLAKTVWFQFINFKTVYFPWFNRTVSFERSLYFDNRSLLRVWKRCPSFGPFNFEQMLLSHQLRKVSRISGTLIPHWIVKDQSEVGKYWNSDKVAVFSTLALVASCSSQLHLDGDKEKRLQLTVLPNWGRAGGVLIYFALPG